MRQENKIEDWLRANQRLESLVMRMVNADDRRIIGQYLDQLYVTHCSICLLTEAHTSHHPHVSDASSLCREQVEKLLYITYLCSDYETHSRAMTADFGRKYFEKFLHDASPNGRFNFGMQKDKLFQKWISRFKLDSKQFGLTELAIDAIFSNSRQKLERNHQLYESLPKSIPGNKDMVKKFSAELKRLFESTWMPEIQHYSQYSHALLSKIIYTSISSGVAPPLEPETILGKIDELKTLSYTAALLGVTIAASVPSWKSEILPELVNEWETTKELSHHGRLSWEHFVQPSLCRISMKQVS